MADTSGIFTGMLLLGAANLIPWMTYLSMADYFELLYGDNQMEFCFPAVSTSMLVISSALNLAFGERFSFTARILVPTLCMGVLMMTVPVVDVLVHRGILGLSSAFALTLGAAFANAICASVAQSSMYGLASFLGQSATQALQTGVGAIGIVAVGLRALTKLGLSPSASMWAFFSAGAALLMLSALQYSLMVASPAVRARMGAYEIKRRSVASSEQSLKTQMLDEGTASGQAEAGRWWSVLGSVWLPSASVFVVFVVCLACFPGLATSFHARNDALSDWFPLLLVGAYNVGDFIGKALPSRLRLIETGQLPFCVCAHVCFVPAFLVLLQPGTCTSDLLPLGLVFALGVCSGYVGCMCLVLATEQAAPQDRELAGMVSSFSLMVGLASGSMLALKLGELVSSAAS